VRKCLNKQVCVRKPAGSSRNGYLATMTCQSYLLFLAFLKIRQPLRGQNFHWKCPSTKAMVLKATPQELKYRLRDLLRKFCMLVCRARQYHTASSAACAVPSSVSVQRHKVHSPLPSSIHLRLPKSRLRCLQVRDESQSILTHTSTRVISAGMDSKPSRPSRTRWSCPPDSTFILRLTR